MHQPLLGAMLPLLIAAAIYARRRGRLSLRMLILTPLSMAACALWAVAPDLPRIVGAHGLYRRLATDPRTNIFFWHYALDQVEHLYFEPLEPLFNVLFAVVILLLPLAAWLELRRAESETRNLKPET